MKIYNKKLFFSGIFMLALGTLNLILDLINHTFGASGAVLMAALYFTGGSAVLRSLSLRMTKEDKLEKSDERNQLIALKSKSKSFTLMQLISFLLMLILLAAGKMADDEGLIYMSIGMGLIFSISMFAEIFTYMYYETKN